MEKLLKMADFLGDLIYRVFDLIWHFKIPTTNIQIVYILLLMLLIDIIFNVFLGFNFIRAADSSGKKIAATKTNLSSWKQEASARVKQKILNEHKNKK